MKKLQVIFFTEVDLPNNVVFTLYEEDKEIDKPKILRKTATNNLFFYELELSKEFEFGHHTYLMVPNYPPQTIDTSYASTFPQFDDLFYYDEDDLGITYSKKSTTFKIWAPLASQAILMITLPGQKNFSFFMMERGEFGVYHYTIEGDLKGCNYYYKVNNSGVISNVTDPYGKFVSKNSEYSVVDDISLIRNRKKYPVNNEFKKMTDAIIYETNVRDFTEDKNTDIVHKAKFKGIIEEGRKTTGGNPAGLDYLKFLGVTHVQFNPIIDFNSLKDDETNKKYNWGYDPISFFAIEGSYSEDPSNAMLRLEEFRDMIDGLHKAGIRVVMDVVYNHIYEYTSSVFEKVVPNYYFRRKHNGEVSNGSGCGNDVASERKMVRKILVDSAKYFIDVFDVDGFRFDLMGLTDIDTMLEIERETKRIKPDIILYGEGWNMYCPLPYEKRSCIDNAFKLKGFGFFNDTYRDIIKGPTFMDRITVKGYALGDTSYVHGADYVFHASVLNRSYSPKFMFAHQSINYVECHDNGTLYDKLLQSNPEEDEDSLRRRIKLTNAMVLMSFGVPFIHMGQEIGQTKHGLDNTYNVLKVNNMDWSKVDKDFDMVVSLRGLIMKRKKLNVLHTDNPHDIESVFEVEKREDGLLVYKCKNKELLKDFDELMIFINPTRENKLYKLDGYYKVFSASGKNIQIENLMIDPIKSTILYR